MCSSRKPGRWGWVGRGLCPANWSSEAGGAGVTYPTGPHLLCPSRPRQAASVVGPPAAWPPAPGGSWHTQGRGLSLHRHRLCLLLHPKRWGWAGVAQCRGISLEIRSTSCVSVGSSGEWVAERREGPSWPPSPALSPPTAPARRRHLRPPRGRTYSGRAQLSKMTIRNYHQLNVCHVPGTPLALLWIISFTPLSKPVVLEVSLPIHR